MVRPFPAHPTRTPFSSTTPAHTISSSSNSASVLGSVRPVGRVDPVWAWASLAAENEKTSELTTAFAMSIFPKEDIALRLSPARHLLEAAHGTTDTALASQISLPLAQSIKTATRVSYGNAVIQYLRWCEEIGLPQHYRFPAATNILSCFLTHDQDKRRASTTSQKTYALLHWHRIHRMPWALDSADTRLLRRSSKLESLPQLEKRRPVRLLDLKAIQPQVSVIKPEEVAVWAAALFAFFAMCRPGEISVRSLTASTAARARWSSFSSVAPRGQKNIGSVVLRLPSEKVHGSAGFDRIVAQQRQIPNLCPVEAFSRHQHANAPRGAELATEVGAFSYIGRNGQRREMTDSFFIKTVNAWLHTAGREKVTGHCFRIGGATFFFSAGKPLDDIRVRGGWESDAYLTYIRDNYVRHAEMFGDIDPTHLFYG